MIKDRKVNPKEGSYTNYLFDKGIDKILKKLGEEATEIVIAAKNPNANEIKYEIADFLYHMMVLMVERGVTWEEITEELDKLYILRSQLKTIQKRIAAAGTLGDEGRLDKLADDFIQINKQLEKYGVFKKISIKVTDFADKYQHLMNKKNFTRLSNAETIAVAASVFDTSVNIADTVKTYAKLNANTAAYMENLDIIAYLAENGDKWCATPPIKYMAFSQVDLRTITCNLDLQFCMIS